MCANQSRTAADKNARTAHAVVFFLGHVGHEQVGPHAQFSPANHV